MPPDWSQLPTELLQVISTKIFTITDYIRFRAVCTSWRSTSSPRPRHLPQQLPWLMLPYDDLADSATRGFFSILDGKTHSLDIPEACGTRCCGSSHGWLVLERGLTISLLNPITRAQIQLPPLTLSPTVLRFRSLEEGGLEFVHQGPFPVAYNFRRYLHACIKKAILSSNPSLNQDATIVMAILNGDFDLAFCRVGGDSWTVIQGSAYLHLGSVVDVSYQSGRFYSIDIYGRVIAYDVGLPAAAVFLPPLVHHSSGNQKYIVERESGELLIVAWNFNNPNHTEEEYSVFKLELDLMQSWSEVKNMDGHMLFLDTNHCLSLPASSPSGWRRNCICFAKFYYLQNYEQGDLGSHDLCFFSLEDGSVVHLPCNLGSSLMSWSPPIWFSPSLY